MLDGLKEFLRIYFKDFLRINLKEQDNSRLN